MPYIIDGGIWSSVFAVPTAVVDQHIKMCSPLSLKILLMMLRHAGTPVDAAWLSEQLRLPAADISDAINYWVGAGIVSDTDKPVSALSPAASAAPAPALPAAQQPAPALCVTETKDAVTGQKITTISARPRVSRADIAEMAQVSPPFSQLLKEAQQVLGAPLDPAESATLASLFGYYKFEPGVILMLLQYCVSIGKPSMKYLESIASDWIDRGITAHDDAEREITRLAESNGNQKKVISAFRIQGRSLSAREREFVNDWFSLGLDERLIPLACEATLDKTGKVSFSYAGKILTAWKEKRINTPAAAIEDLKSPTQKPSTPQNRAAQTAGSSIDKQKLTDLIHGQFLKD